jgi:hypothetical protein
MSHESKIIYRVPDIETTDADGKQIRLTEIEVYVVGDDSLGIANSIDSAFGGTR